MKQIESPAQDECYRCGYDLRGIADDQPCPECGLLALRSRRETDELHDTRPKWLRTISRGTWIILLSLLFLPILPFFLSFAEIAIRNSLAYWFPFVNASEMAAYLGACLALGGVVLGSILLTAPEGYEPADNEDRSRRMLIRIFSIVPIIGVVTMQVIGRLRWRRWTAGNRELEPLIIEILPTLILTIGLIPFVCLLYKHLKSLAIRARSAHLSEHCSIVGIGTSASLAYIAVALFVTAWMDRAGWATHWKIRSNLWLVVMLLVGTAAGLFFLWALYLLTRFAIAFHSASRQLRKKWRRDDQAHPAATGDV